MSLVANCDTEFMLLYIDRLSSPKELFLGYAQFGKTQIAARLDDDSTALLTQFPQSGPSGTALLSDSEIEASVRMLKASIAVRQIAVVAGWKASSRAEDKESFDEFLATLFRTEDQDELDKLIKSQETNQSLDILLLRF